MSLLTATFTFRPIGTVHSPYAATHEIPKGLGAEHRAEGTIEIFPEYEAGLQDVEGRLAGGSRGAREILRPEQPSATLRQWDSSPSRSLR